MTQLSEEIQKIMQIYLDNGVTIIPIYPQTKKPCISWETYEDFKPSKAEMTEWFRTFWNPQTWLTNNYWIAKWIAKRRENLQDQGLTPEQINSNPKLIEYDGSISLAVLAGKNSGNLAIIDDDVNGLSKEELDFYKEKTLVVKTNSGYHIYVKLFNPPPATKAGDNGEIRGEGAYAIAPPSTHVLGDKYTIVSSTTKITQITSDEKEKELLKWAKEKIGTKKKKPQKKTFGTIKKADNKVTPGLEEWVSNFLEQGFLGDHVNALSLKLFGPAIAQAKIPTDQGVKMILEWATNCHNLKGADMTVNEEKIQRMVESAAEKGISPLTKEGLNYEYPEIYEQLVEQGVIVKRELPTYKDFCDTDEQGHLFFKPARVAEWLKENKNFKTDYDSEILYYFNGKIWIPRAEQYVRELVAKILGEEDREAHYRNIEHHLKAITLTNVVFSNKIAVKNGLLDLETQTLTDANPVDMPFYEIPQNYNQNYNREKLSNWLEFLKEVAETEDIPLLQEWFGYCFLPDYRFHKALWIHGEGRNGKGVFDRTIKGIIGHRNVSTVGLEELDGTQRFALKDLYGKLYNSTSEPTTNKVFRTEIFQKITGSDLIHAEFKNANKEVEFTNCSKITIIGNKFPRIHNPPRAFKDRMLFVKFPNFFSDKDRIPNLEKVWLNDPDQCTAIFMWALEGLKRLLSQGYFTQTKSQKETEIAFLRVADPSGAFILEKAIFDKNIEILRTDALLQYQNYCEDIGVNADARALTDTLNRLSPRVRSSWSRIEGKNQRVWKGVTFKKEDGSQEQELKTSQQTELPQLPQMPQQKPYSETFNAQKKENNKSAVVSVVSVAKENPALGESEIRYTQLACYFCGKGIYTNDWKQDGFTENKPAHKECYEDKQKELADGFDKEGS